MGDHGVNVKAFDGLRAGYKAQAKHKWPFLSRQKDKSCDASGDSAVVGV